MGTPRARRARRRRHRPDLATRSTARPDPILTASTPRGDPIATRTCPLDGADLPPGAVICRACVGRTRGLLQAVPGYLQALDEALSRQTAMHAVGGRGGCPEGCTHDPDDPGCVAGVRVDVDDRASDARAALLTVLHGWVRVWDEETPRHLLVEGPLCWGAARGACGHASCRAVRLGLADRERDRLLATPAGQAGLLRGIRDLISRPWAAELVGELRDVARQVVAAIERPPDMTVIGRCTTCRTPLYAPEGADAVRCSSCGQSALRDDVRDASLAESRTLVTIVQLAEILGVPERTVRSWRHRGRLVAVRSDLAGRPLYRVRDGQALRARGEDTEPDPQARASM